MCVCKRERERGMGGGGGEGVWADLAGVDARGLKEKITTTTTTTTTTNNNNNNNNNKIKNFTVGICVPSVLWRLQSLTQS